MGKGKSIREKEFCFKEKDNNPKEGGNGRKVVQSYHPLLIVDVVQTKGKKVESPLELDRDKNQLNSPKSKDFTQKASSKGYLCWSGVE